MLTVIQGYTECLIARCQGDSITSQALKQISDGAKRAAALTRQLLMFSRKQVIQTAVLDLNGVLRNVANMLVRLLGEDIRLETQYASGLPRIEADTGMLEQVVMNLAVNSRDAIPQGGRLKISTEAVKIDPAYVAQHPESRAGDFVCLTVEDTGGGMDRATIHLPGVGRPVGGSGRPRRQSPRGAALRLQVVADAEPHGHDPVHLGWIGIRGAVSDGGPGT